MCDQPVQTLGKNNKIVQTNTAHVNYETMNGISAYNTVYTYVVDEIEYNCKQMQG